MRQNTRKNGKLSCKDVVVVYRGGGSGVGGEKATAIITGHYGYVSDDYGCGQQQRVRWSGLGLLREIDSFSRRTVAATREGATHATQFLHTYSYVNRMQN